MKNSLSSARNFVLQDPNEKQSDRLSAPSDKQQPPPQPWQGRGPPTMSPSDFRNQISRPSPHPASMLVSFP